MLSGLPKLLRPAVSAALLLLAGTAAASFHLWQVDQIFTDSTGNVQFIRMTTTFGGQEFVSGNQIITTQGAASHTFRFPVDLPGDTTNHKFLIATQGFAALNIVTPDFTVPNGFLFSSSGSINYAGFDSVSYSSLPSDGVHALNRAGATVVNSPTNFAGATGSVTAAAPPPPPPGAVAVIEYYDAHDDLYFVTANPAEAAVIDAGADNIGASTWSRTGLQFNAYASPGLGNDVCRFYDPNIAPVGIHFYTALPAECAQVRAALPAWNYEIGNAFNIPLPAGGACSSGFAPVFRYFDQRANESWRFTTDTTVNAAMLAKGWAAEGVQMCSPQ